MMVPLIKLPLTFGLEQLPEWTNRIKAFGLFGRVAIQAHPTTNHTVLEKLIVSTGGLLDVQIVMKSLDDELAISLLNAGAATILVNHLPDPSTIPSDRIEAIQFVDELPEESAPNNTAEIDIGTISKHWLAGVDHLVDFRFLETGEVMASVLIRLLKSDRPDGLWPTIIVDPLGVALGLAYSNAESLTLAIKDRVGVYFSRSRKELWVKGKTSGATQRLNGVRVDCDFDTLRFQVEQGAPGFCHKQTHTCFGYERNIAEVLQRLQERVQSADENSFTKKLVNDPEMLRKKLLEEAQELSDASSSDEAAWEAADVLYFSIIAMMRNGASLPEVYQELARRMQRVIRRKNKLEKTNE